MSADKGSLRGDVTQFAVRVWGCRLQYKSTTIQVFAYTVQIVVLELLYCSFSFLFKVYSHYFHYFVRVVRYSPYKESYWISVGSYSSDP